MNEVRLRIHLRIDSIYYHIAGAWRKPIEHKGLTHDAIMFTWPTVQYLESMGIQSGHYTYPDTGEIHITYAFIDGKTAHVSPDRVNLTWGRDHELKSFPTLETLAFISRGLQRKNASPFVSSPTS